jgi:hypothetical protein
LIAAPSRPSAASAADGGSPPPTVRICALTSLAVCGRVDRDLIYAAVGNTHLSRIFL